MKTIALFTSVYFNNIGNGFIDLGAEETLKRAIPSEYSLIKISQCANFAASMGKSFTLKENAFVHWIWENLVQKNAKVLHDRSYKIINTLDVFSVPKMIKMDYLVIPGCVLTVPFFTIYGNLLKEKVKQGTKLVFLGASGNFYTDYEVSVVSEYLRELKPLAIMTRDSIAYEKYFRFAELSYSGIDNAFFVNKINIPKVDTIPEKYVVVNLEEPKNKALKEKLVKKLKSEGMKIVYTYHKPFPYSKVSDLVKKGVIVSDYPMDYLVLYKNAAAVYSDRVHACIPTLSFGNAATIYSDSPRKALFENVGVKELNKKPMKIDGLEKMQEDQIDYLKKVFLE